jgi:hypothetical protein
MNHEKISIFHEIFELCPQICILCPHNRTTPSKFRAEGLGLILVDTHSVGHADHT